MGTASFRLTAAAGFMLAFAGADEVQAKPVETADTAKSNQEECPERKILLNESKWVKPDLGKKKRRYVRM